MDDEPIIIKSCSITVNISIEDDGATGILETDEVCVMMVS